MDTQALDGTSALIQTVYEGNELGSTPAASNLPTDCNAVMVLVKNDINITSQNNLIFGRSV